MSQHTEWLSMIEVSGPFLAVSVLEKVFPQGLESLETYRKRRIRSAYEEWRDAVEEDDSQLPELHRAWIALVLREALEYEDSVLVPAKDNFSYRSPDGGGQFSPDFVLQADEKSTPMLFVSILPEGTDLEKVKVGDGWPVPVFERMTLLCRDKGVRLGLITNGERWMIVNAPVGNTSSHISWYARLWFQEPVTLKAFQSLLGVRRWFGPVEETLPFMLEESLQHHEEVTDTLGEQVKRAVEVLVQCLDKADQDRNRELLHDVPPSELYEAGLTVMMRLVFVLCAEERGLLLLGDSIYDQYYAISTLRGQLDEERHLHGDEVLERRHDAWTRLLAVFRAVYGGIEHESLRMLALGGSLFDPDRFPFLEGRSKGTYWKETPAQPLPIDNRTVLLLLEALQVLNQRTGALLLSYKALDVEQIGHVYEGLLEHTVRKLPKDTLGLMGSQKAKNPNLPLVELESARLEGEEALVSIVETTTLRSRSAIGKALEKEVDDALFGKVVTGCGGDMELANRIKPFAHLLRTDAWGDFIVYRANSFAVTLGADRRETGTHYTPKSLTESIVETTLEPVAYIGPAEGKPREKWQLKSSSELQELKICDPAMGSGAFLVQVCRWLSERLVEAWGQEASKGKFITVDGVALESAGSAEPMPDSLDERLLIARRLVAEKCLYGVDLNPLAVELAKLSIWLITLAKGRPFGFLDHNMRSGDSLLGLHKLEQLTKFSLHPEKKKTTSMFASNIEAAVTDALALRKQLRETPIRDIRDVQHMKRLDLQARQKLEKIEHIADAMIGEALASGGNQRTLDDAMETLSTWGDAYIEGDNETGRKIIAEARKSLSIDLPTGKPPRRPFHWALEFPEVFERGGFDCCVGNPPFLGNKYWSNTIGDCFVSYAKYLINTNPGRSDLCVLFHRRSLDLLNDNGCFGLLGTESLREGDARAVGLDFITTVAKIYRAVPSLKWPGSANVTVCIVWVALNYTGSIKLNGVSVTAINGHLDPAEELITPYILKEAQIGSKGCDNSKGESLILHHDDPWFKTLHDALSPYLRIYVTAKDMNDNGFQNQPRWVIHTLNHRLDKIQEVSPVTHEFLLDHVKHNRTQDVLKGLPGLFERWWQFNRHSTPLYNAIREKETCIVMPVVSKYVLATRVSSRWVFTNKFIIFKDAREDLLGIMQSNFFKLWVRKYSGSLGGTMSVSLKWALNTFSFPHLRSYTQITSLSNELLKTINNMITKEEIGYTEVYNRFHSSDFSDADVEQLRKLQIEIDQAVATAYGWENMDLDHDFHETKQGIRFTISEEARREVLQRLLKLNHERYAEEVAQGLHDKKKTKKPATPRKKKASPTQVEGSIDLFNFMDKPRDGSE
ncbi:Eco57I restriction-modification methylase domain-containing protein [Verrucomicrobiota bacterium]